ncbi:hypothetical protein BRADI_1g58952v3 [Brachypodium distachyon]|uniref:Uncharacterized protein n=1 Tax=Brachypodium distachyon TaxID=15368 RepID=A0A0Q3JU80_BRADI|nr:hypothetical protein BRADI_1g58952v3 [Brachypodium distachyon]
MAAGVVAALSGAEHRRAGAQSEGHVDVGRGHVAPVARQGVPDEEVPRDILDSGGRGDEEGAAVAAVDGEPAGKEVIGGAEGGGGDETVGGGDETVTEEPQHGRRPVELEVAAAESAAGDDAAPRPADGGGADEVVWLVRRQAEEDLLEELVQQCRRQRRHGGGGAGLGSRASWACRCRVARSGYTVGRFSTSFS